MIRFTKQDIIPYIEKEGRLIARMIQNAKLKYGDRYNFKNEFEEMYRRFGNPQYDPERFADEMSLLLDKKSSLPASVRYTVSKVLNGALEKMMVDKAKEADSHEEQQKTL